MPHDRIKAFEAENNKDIFKFLNGFRDYEGVWYGEDHPDHVGHFWWRSVMDDQLEALKQKAITDYKASLREAVTLAMTTASYTEANHYDNGLEKALSLIDSAEPKQQKP